MFCLLTNQNTHLQLPMLAGIEQLGQELVTFPTGQTSLCTFAAAKAELCTSLWKRISKTYGNREAGNREGTTPAKGAV